MRHVLWHSFPLKIRSPWTWFSRRTGIADQVHGLRIKATAPVSSTHPFTWPLPPHPDGDRFSCQVTYRMTCTVPPSGCSPGVFSTWVGEREQKIERSCLTKYQPHESPWDFHFYVWHLAFWIPRWIQWFVCLAIFLRQFTAKPFLANLNPSDSAESNLACQGNDGGGGITIDKFLSTRPCIYTVLVQANFRKHTFIIDHHSLTFLVEHYNSETRILGHWLF